MGSKSKTVDMSMGIDDEKGKKGKKSAKTEKPVVTEATEVAEDADAKETVKVKKVSRERSDRYKAARRRVDRTKTYPLAKAVEMVKVTSYSNFKGTVTVDAIVKDQKTSAEITFPHSTGRTLKVAIADDALLATVEAGKIDFDILLATPAMMPKIAKFARILGPKGLMPNPKNGTVTNEPEKRQKELSGGKVTLRTEKKAPLMHVVVGKTTLTDKGLTENIEAMIKAVGAKKLVKLTLSATMSPGIKVDLTPYQQQ